MVLLPGYGLPAPAGADLRPEALAELLLHLLPDRRVLLVGHSASCQVVAHAARLAPGRVRAVLLVGPTTDPRADSWPRLAGRWLATATHEHPGEVPTLVRQYRRTTLRTMARAMDAARRDRIDRTVRATSCPRLVLRGRHDAICPPEWADEVAAAGGTGLGKARTLGAGAHMVPLTHGDLVAGALDGLLDQTDRFPAV